jgi:hypothetical protein
VTRSLRHYLWVSPRPCTLAVRSPASPGVKCRLASASIIITGRVYLNGTMTLAAKLESSDKKFGLTEIFFCSYARF